MVLVLNFLSFKESSWLSSTSMSNFSYRWLSTLDAAIPCGLEEFLWIWLFFHSLGMKSSENNKILSECVLCPLDYPTLGHLCCIDKFDSRKVYTLSTCAQLYLGFSVLHREASIWHSEAGFLRQRVEVDWCFMVLQILVGAVHCLAIDALEMVCSFVILQV